MSSVACWKRRISDRPCGPHTPAVEDGNRVWPCRRDQVVPQYNRPVHRDFESVRLGVASTAAQRTNYPQISAGKTDTMNYIK